MMETILDILLIVKEEEMEVIEEDMVEIEVEEVVLVEIEVIKEDLEEIEEIGVTEVMVISKEEMKEKVEDGRTLKWQALLQTGRCTHCPTRQQESGSTLRRASRAYDVGSKRSRGERIKHAGCLEIW